MIDDKSLIMVSLEKLDSKVERLDDKVDSMGEILSKQELILEKILHVEDRVNHVSNVVHKRIDDVCTQVSAIVESQTKTGCPVFQSCNIQRKEQLKAYDKEIDKANRNFDKIFAELARINNLPNIILFKVFLSLVSTGLLGLIAYWIGGRT